MDDVASTRSLDERVAGKWNMTASTGIICWGVYFCHRYWLKTVIAICSQQWMAWVDYVRVWLPTWMDGWNQACNFFILTLF
jgi:hypothetical protein